MELLLASKICEYFLDQLGNELVSIKQSAHIFPVSIISQPTCLVSSIDEASSFIYPFITFSLDSTKSIAPGRILQWNIHHIIISILIIKVVPIYFDVQIYDSVIIIVQTYSLYIKLQETWVGIAWKGVTYIHWRAILNTIGIIQKPESWRIFWIYQTSNLFKST